MAMSDWKRYYAPILAHKTSGECRIWKGKLFGDREKALAKCRQINKASASNYRCIGLAGLRGKNHKVQQQLWKSSNGR